MKQNQYYQTGDDYFPITAYPARQEVLNSSYITAIYFQMIIIFIY